MKKKTHSTFKPLSIFLHLKILKFLFYRLFEEKYGFGLPSMMVVGVESGFSRRFKCLIQAKFLCTFARKEFEQTEVKSCEFSSRIHPRTIFCWVTFCSNEFFCDGIKKVIWRSFLSMPEEDAVRSPLASKIFVKLCEIHSEHTFYYNFWFQRVFSEIPYRKVILDAYYLTI